MPVDEAALTAAIDAHPAEAADALAALQTGLPVPFTIASLVPVARRQGKTTTELLIAQLAGFDQLDAYAQALRGQGIPVGDPEPEVVDHVDPKLMKQFAPRAQVRRCRVFVNGDFKGTGHLIGPRLVMTAWHVVAVDPPGMPQVPPREIVVQLDDGTRWPAKVPSEWEWFCGDDEYREIGPTSEEQIHERFDVAILRLEQPVAFGVGFADLPAEPPPAAAKTTVFLAHFPEGQDPGLGVGRMARIPNLTSRWYHDITTSPGSSGGACFDASFRLAGIHQGRWKKDKLGRLVPIGLFLERLQAVVKTDIAPDSLWSLNEQADGQLVIGRQGFFEAVAEVATPTGAARGIRVRRENVPEGDTGLAYSYDILAQLLMRRGASHRLVRLIADAPIADFETEMRARTAAAAQIVIPDIPRNAGVVPGQAAMEGAVRDRADLLARAFEDAATAADSTLWFFFDNPTAIQSDETQLAFEAFIASAIRQPHLRVVIAGFETVQLAGQAYQSAAAARAATAPGLIVEILVTFRFTDLTDFLAQATKALGGEDDLDLWTKIARRAVKDLDGTNDVYSRMLLPQVMDRLRDDLSLLTVGDGG
jgi:hypothetical protein